MGELEKEIQSVQEMKKKLLEKHDQDSMLIRTQYENRKLAALHSVKMNAKESTIPPGPSSVSYNQSVSSVFASPGNIKQEELLKTISLDNQTEGKGKDRILIPPSAVETKSVKREIKGKEEEDTHSSKDLLAYLQRNESKIFHSEQKSEDERTIEGPSKEKFGFSNETGKEESKTR